MNQNPLYEFPAINQSFGNLYIVLPTLFALCCAAAVVWARGRKSLDSIRRNMLVMVFTFMGLTAAGMATLKVVSIFRLKPVRIFADAIETPYGRLPFSELRDAEVQPFFRFKPMQPGAPTDSTRYLSLFKTGNREPDILSEGDYRVDSIFDALKIVIDRK